jgi:ribosomal protein S9
MEIFARGVGRRKEAVAQVQIVKGTGQFIINEISAEQYLHHNTCSLLSVKGPLNVLSSLHMAQLKPPSPAKQPCGPYPFGVDASLGEPQRGLPQAKGFNSTTFISEKLEKEDQGNKKQIPTSLSKKTPLSDGSQTKGSISKNSVAFALPGEGLPLRDEAGPSGLTQAKVSLPLACGPQGKGYETYQKGKEKEENNNGTLAIEEKPLSYEPEFKDDDKEQSFRGQFFEIGQSVPLVSAFALQTDGLAQAKVSLPLACGPQGKGYEAYQKENIFSKMDTIVKVKGGGLVGQAEAIRLGLARACCSLTTETINLSVLLPNGLQTKGEEIRKQLKDKGYLTQDSRVKERRKYGLKKARKATQYNKR